MSFLPVLLLAGVASAELLSASCSFPGGMVEISEDDRDGLRFKGIVAGLDDLSLGDFRLHTGYSCDDPGEHIFEDVWIADESGVAPIETATMDLSLLDENHVAGRALVFRSSSKRVLGCCLVEMTDSLFLHVDKAILRFSQDEDGVDVKGVVTEPNEDVVVREGYSCQGDRREQFRRSVSDSRDVHIRLPSFNFAHKAIVAGGSCGLVGGPANDAVARFGEAGLLRVVSQSVDFGMLSGLPGSSQGTWSVDASACGTESPQSAFARWKSNEEGVAILAKGRNSSLQVGHSIKIYSQDTLVDCAPILPIDGHFAEISGNFSGALVSSDDTLSGVLLGPPRTTFSLSFRKGYSCEAPGDLLYPLERTFTTDAHGVAAVEFSMPNGAPVEFAYRAVVAVSGEQQRGCGVVGTPTAAAVRVYDSEDKTKGLLQVEVDGSVTGLMVGFPPRGVGKWRLADSCSDPERGDWLLWESDNFGTVIIDAIVGNSLASISGKSLSFFSDDDAELACGTVEPIVDGSFQAVSDYPEEDGGVVGVLLYTSIGKGVHLEGVIAGLEPNSSADLSTHEGYTCHEHEGVGESFYDGIKYASDDKGVAIVSGRLQDNIREVERRATIVGGRSGCGVSGPLMATTSRRVSGVPTQMPTPAPTMLPSEEPLPASKKKKSDSLSETELAIIIVIVILVLVLVAILICIFATRMKKQVPRDDIDLQSSEVAAPSVLEISPMVGPDEEAAKDPNGEFVNLNLNDAPPNNHI